MAASDGSPTPPASPQPAGTEAPPTSVMGILRKLGPGLIVAGSIVGSGELIATTKTGAEAGFWLLWLILFGCLIKVFTQIEFGRFTLTTGKGTLEGLNEVPGPRHRANWIVWYWLIMTFLGIAQQGGIVGGVAQALTISRPLTEAGRQANEYQDLQVRSQVMKALAERAAASDPVRRQTLLMDAEVLDRKRDLLGEPPKAYDTLIWASILIAITTVLLLVGRYGFIQNFSTIFVASFTAVTVFTLLALQTKPDWAMSGAELGQGLSFRLPPLTPAGISPMATALATFGIIGVGAAEIIFYPYWCLEKGYARFTGPREDSDAWRARARGWMRVMRWDAWCSMIIYTFATVAFYLLGAAVLHRTGLNPAGSEMIRTLAEMYVPVFGDWAPRVFLLGAFAVLYSTLFVALASNARVAADAVHVFGLGGHTPKTHEWWVRLFCVVFPLIAIGMLALTAAPAQLVLWSGIAQALMLPMLGLAALFYRYKRCDPALRPSRAWDAGLWISAACFLLIGLWLIWTKLTG